MQGLNAIVDIYERAEGADDAVGGSSRSDVLRYAAVKARIANARVPVEIRLQGLELPDMVDIILWPDQYDAVEVEDIVVPRDGARAEQRLRVTGVRRSSLRVGGPRSHVQLTAVHVAYADNEE